MKYLPEKINNTRCYLLLASLFLVFFLILLSNLKVLPIKNTGDFIFFTGVFLALALYRPGWAFLFFAGTIALENINLAPENIGIAARPYQFFAALTIFAVLARLAAGRLNFKLPKFSRIDGLMIIFALAGFLSAIFSADRGASFKQSIVAASFVAIYFLTRIFIQNSEDLKKIIPFFLSSSIVVVLYGIWQNVRFLHNLNSFEVMPGRPNATFTEADWYGIYLVLALAILFSIIYYLNSKFKIKNSKLLITGCWSLITLTFISLVLTVSRSAWLGVVAVTLIFLALILLKNWQWKLFLKTSAGLAAAGITSIAIVYFFNLTSFQLFNRAQSAGSGLQKITISCRSFLELGSRIGNINELNQYGCRHINLEEIDAEKAAGNFVTEIYRKDPNVTVRNEIYQKSWQEIKNHPILGIGWGSIGEILGRDGRGTALNSSNIFLEIWLGSGLLGLASFLIFWSYIIVMSVKAFRGKQEEFAAYSLFLLLAWVALIVPNLFNAGIFLGLLWIFSGISASLLNYKEEQDGKDRH